MAATISFRISSSLSRGIRTLARCQRADHDEPRAPSGYPDAVYTQSTTENQGQNEEASYYELERIFDENNERAIKYHSVELNGINFHYAKTGAGNTPVLFLPGALGSAQTDFGPQLEGINKDMFTMIGWDPRGYGKSQGTPRNWNKHFLERDAHDAALLMKTLKYESYSLVGWSDGGITALIMAAKYPHRIKKCVTLAANTYVTKGEVDSYMKISDVSQWSERMRKPFIEMYGEEKFKQLWAEWIEYFTKYAENPEGNICKHMLKDIECPVLVVQGQQDMLVPSYHAEYIAKHLRISRLVQYPEGKHNLHFKYANEFNSLVQSFLIEPLSTIRSNERIIPEQ